MELQQKTLKTFTIWSWWIPVGTQFRPWSTQSFTCLCLSGNPDLVHGPDCWTLMWQGTTSPWISSNHEESLIRNVKSEKSPKIIVGRKVL